MNKVFIFAILGILLVSSVSALTVDYYYSPTCPHCQKVSPIVQQLYNQFNFHEWHFYDVSKGSYNIDGVPSIKIKTGDCREIELKGSYEIPKYLKCELQEQSTLECPTHSELIKGSFFLE